MEIIQCLSSYKKIKFNPLHEHGFWELIRLVNGKALYTVGGKTYELCAGDLVLVPPGVLHNCEYKEFFSDGIIQFTNCDLPERSVFIRDIDGNIGRLFLMMEKLFMEKEAYYRELVESLLNSILVYIKKAASFEVAYPFVYAFKDLLYENLSNPELDIGKAILESGYNPDYFRRCFKKEFHKSPLEYLNLLRLTRAKQLLIQADFTSIENVASRCGFSDNHYFSTFFKKHKGIPPLQYRKMKLNRNNGANS